MASPATSSAATPPSGTSRCVRLACDRHYHASCALTRHAYAGRSDPPRPSRTALSGRGGHPFFAGARFEKFSSNSGWCSGLDPILEAFSHWSWARLPSATSELVCDLQGHRGNGVYPHLGNDYYYLLTDPAICSMAREYGESDLGYQVSCWYLN